MSPIWTGIAQGLGVGGLYNESDMDRNSLGVPYKMGGGLYKVSDVDRKSSGFTI
jgi:hypothetical protein